MKEKILLLFLMMNVYGIASFAQTREPDNTISDAKYLPINTVLKDSVNYPNVSDFHKAILPKSGSGILKVILKATSANGNGGTIGYRLWSKTGKELANKIFNLPANKTLSATDSTVYYSYQLDTCYIEIYDVNTSSSFPKNYEIKYEESPLTHSDIESNDQIADALALGINSIAQGLVGFQQQTQGQYKLDVSDFYRVTLPLNGSNILKVTLKATSVYGNGGTIGYRLWSKTGKELANKIFNLPANKTLSATDSTVYYSYQLDTCYIQVYDFNASGTYPKTYEIKYEESPLTHSDTESNDQIADALALGVNTIAQGLVGFQQQTQGQYKLDVSDFYRVTLPLNGNNVLKVNLKATSVSGNGGTIGYRLWSKTGKELVNKTFGLPTNKTLSATDSTVYYSSQLDTCYIQVYDFNANGNYPKTYVLRCENRNIITGFDAVQYNNDITIINKSNGDSFLWDFGDGSPKSNMKLPVHTYTKVGDFIVTQQVMVNGTTLKVEETKIVSVRGVESYTPKEAGAGGDVTINIYGGGLDTTTVVKLIGKSETLLPLETYKAVPGMISCLFDFHRATEGIYDVSVQMKGESQPVVFSEGFTINKFTYPRVVSSISGYGTLRTGRQWNYVLELTNTGSVMANGVTAYLAIPDGVKITKTLKRDTESGINRDFVYYSDILEQTITIPYQDIKNGADSMYQEYFEVDTLFGEPFKGKVYILDFAFIAPNATFKFPFIAESTTGDESLKTSMLSFVEPVNLWGSCESTKGAEEMYDKSGANLLINVSRTALSFSDDPAAKVGSITIGLIDAYKGVIGGVSMWAGAMTIKQPGGWGERFKVARDIAWGGAYGNPTSYEQWEAARTGVGKVIVSEMKDLALGGFKIKNTLNKKYNGEIPEYIEWKGGLSRVQDVMKNTTSQKLQLLQKEKELLTKEYVDLLNEQNTSIINTEAWGKRIDDYVNRMKSYNKEVNTANLQYRFATEESLSGMYDLGDKGQKVLNTGNALINAYFANTPCADDLEKQLEYLKDHPEVWEKIYRKSLTIGTSVDPNEIEGPQGIGSKHFIKNDDQMNYTIRFENKPEASLAAQIVNVYDTIDLQKYDVNTFELSHITIADSMIIVPPGRKEYFTRFDMRPKIDLITGISVKLDENTGIIHWQFTSLDPATNDLTNDPEAGFLPPNKNSHEGEGSVSFRAKLKDLADGTSINNRADIRFDSNDPILTNIWTNVIDKNNPTGSVTSVSLQNDSTFTVSWNGNDAVSGIEYYKLYGSYNDSTFVKVGNFYENDITLVGYPKEKFAFYVIPVDSVGNTQVKDAIAEGSIILPVKEDPEPNNQDEAVIFYPNPNKANNAFNMRVNTSDSGELEVFFYDIMGHLIGSQKLEHEGGTRTYTLNDLSLYTRGMYLGRVKLNGKDLKTVKLLVN